MQACRSELTITKATLAAWTVWVAAAGDAIGGMIALDASAGGRQGELEHFFVEPALQGRGVGALLMSALTTECRRRGVMNIGLDADPFAESIYHRFGFRTVGRAPSKSMAGRTLPRMEKILTDGS